MHNTIRFDSWRKRTLIEVKRLTWLCRLNHLVSENSVSGLLSACKCNYDSKAKSCYSRWLFILFVRTERDEGHQARLGSWNYYFSCRMRTIHFQYQISQCVFDKQVVSIAPSLELRTKLEKLITPHYKNSLCSCIVSLRHPCYRINSHRRAAENFWEVDDTRSRRPPTFATSCAPMQPEGCRENEVKRGVWISRYANAKILRS